MPCCASYRLAQALPPLKKAEAHNDKLVLVSSFLDGDMVLVFTNPKLISATVASRFRATSCFARSARLSLSNGRTRTQRRSVLRQWSELLKRHGGGEDCGAVS